MSFSERFISVFKSLLPSPFTIALLLTVVTYFIAMMATEVPEAKINFSQTSIDPGNSVSLSTNSDQNISWSTGENAPTIEVTPLGDTTITLEVAAKKGDYVNQAAVVISKNGDQFSIAEAETAGESKYLQSLRFWEGGLWTNGLLVFALQMMLMLVLGHVLALTRPVNRFIDRMASLCANTAQAAFLVSFLTILVSFLNWGLALIFGAILARKVGEYAARRGISLNYAIVGAAGYSGLMTWHGGFSGSAPIKVAESGHLKDLMSGIMTEAEIASLPERLSMDITVWSNMNLTVMALLLVLVPVAMYLLGRSSKPAPIKLPTELPEQEKPTHIRGVENLDHWRITAWSFAAIILGFAVFRIVEEGSLRVITPNFINLCLLGLGLVLHGSLFRFLKAVDKAIGGSSGILIQFPIYFGIMAIMNKTGLVHVFSDFFVAHSTSTTFPLLTFASAGIVNVFVPSGGGQWGVQGPIIIKAAMDLGVSYPKAVMALAYGDQVTNMLQPFWALPLLGITGLKAKEILPYTLFLFLVGTAIFITALLIF